MQSKVVNLIIRKLIEVKIIRNPSRSSIQEIIAISYRPFSNKILY